MIIASYLHFSDLQSVLKISSVFNQIFNTKLNDYKQFYENLTWDTDGWNSKLNEYFNVVISELYQALPYQKVYRISLLKSRFLRSLTPQSVFEHVCFCTKSNCPGKHKGKCQLCCPVNFFDSEYRYFECFSVGLSDLELKIVINLYKHLKFDFFGQVPNNWFQRLNTNYFQKIVHYHELLNIYASTMMKIFCNVFLSEQTVYSDLPMFQFLSFRRCLFLESKKFMNQISAFINRKFFRFFIVYACPYSDYNYDYLKILNEQYYQFLVLKKYFDQNSGTKFFRKVYKLSALKFYKDDWNSTFH